MNCEICQTECGTKRFCSAVCVGKNMVQKRPVLLPQGKCRNCNKAIKTNRKFCSSCPKTRKKTLNNGLKACTLCKEEKNIINNYYNDKTPRCKQCMQTMAVKRSQDFIRKCVEYKGGECQKCGYNRCHKALEFHHRNPEDKLFEISDKRNCSFNKSITDELDKCEILCVNCHRENHWKENNEL